MTAWVRENVAVVGLGLLIVAAAAIVFWYAGTVLGTWLLAMSDRSRRRWRMTSSDPKQRALDVVRLAWCILTRHLWGNPSPSGQLVCRRCWTIEEPTRDGN